MKLKRGLTLSLITILLVALVATAFPSGLSSQVEARQVSQAPPALTITSPGSSSEPGPVIGTLASTSRVAKPPVVTRTQ